MGCPGPRGNGCGRTGGLLGSRRGGRRFDELDREPGHVDACTQPVGVVADHGRTPTIGHWDNVGSDRVDGNVPNGSSDDRESGSHGCTVALNGPDHTHVRNADARASQRSACRPGPPGK